MFRFLKTGVSVLAVSALFLAPAATVTMITADAAYAKNGNGNGNGNGGGNRGGGAGKGNGKGESGSRSNGNKSAKAKGNSGFKGFGNKGSKSKSASNTGFGKGLKSFGNSFKNDMGKLFGGKSSGKSPAAKKAGVTRVSAPSKSLRPPSGRPAAYKDAGKFGTLHPSQLGKLNGAINSSARAKEAHIANGQFAKGTGPVSLAAALAVEDYRYQEALGGYSEALGTVALADAFDTLDGVPAEDVMDAQDLVSAYDTDLDGVLSEAERQAAIDATADTDNPLTHDDLDSAQSLNDAAGLTEGQEAPSSEDIADAQSVVDEGEPTTESVEQAEDNLLAHYKGDLPTADEDSDMRLSDEEQQVVDTVRANNPDDETVGEALDTYEARMDTDDDPDDDMAEGDGSDLVEDDESESAMMEDGTSES